MPNSIFLISNNYTCSTTDHSLFLIHDHHHIITLLIYVDDIVLTGNHSKEITRITDLFHSTFRIKNLGNLTYFLGLEVSRNSSSIHLCQQNYVLDILLDIGMLDSTPVPTAMVFKHNLSTSDALLDDIVVTSFRCLIAKLIYLTTTCHDIPFIVHHLS